MDKEQVRRIACKIGKGYGGIGTISLLLVRAGVFLNRVERRELVEKR